MLVPENAARLDTRLDTRPGILSMASKIQKCVTKCLRKLIKGYVQWMFCCNAPSAWSRTGAAAAEYMTTNASEARQQNS